MQRLHWIITSFIVNMPLKVCFWMCVCACPCAYPCVCAGTNASVKCSQLVVHVHEAQLYKLFEC